MMHRARLSMSENHQLDFGLLRDPVENLPPVTVVDDFPLHRPITTREVFVIRNCESRYLTHDFHKFAGKFIPHIPRWAIKKLLPRRGAKMVLDPFTGSGTTLVEAMLDGHVGYGVDVDPLARLITKVKTTVIAEDRLRSIGRVVTRKLDSLQAGSFMPEIPTLKHWFTSNAIRDLSAIYETVEEFRDDTAAYDLLTICFSAIIRRVSNADNQTMKTYVSHTHKKRPEAAKPLFLRTVAEYSARLAKFQHMVPKGGRALVLDDANAKTLDHYWTTKKLPLVDLAIGSPPYIKSVDYIYNQMVELFWIGHRWNLETQPLQNEYKSHYIGNDRNKGRSGPPPELTGMPIVDVYLERIFERDPKLARVACNYFRDMSAHFSAVRKVLRPESRYVMVIGDSTLAGVAVPTHSLLISCAKEAGFEVLGIFGYEIRNKHMRFPRQGRGGVVSHDWVIEFRKG
jgi:hypothetical protein